MQPHRDMEAFRSTLQDCDLTDAGFQGDPFTWRKDNMEVRLDRFLINLSWRLRFQDAFIKHLDHLKSDHRPLLICFLKEKRRNMRRRPFRFEAAWLSHDDFSGFVRRCWGLEEGIWTDKIGKLQQELRTWNKEVFGCISSKKKQLLRHINWLDKQYSLHGDSRMAEEYMATWREYEMVLAQEEVH